MTDLEEELFCNAAAANWILSDTGLDAAVVQKRALGVAVGMLMLTARGLGSADSHDGIHPPGYEPLSLCWTGTFRMSKKRSGDS